MQSRLQRSLSKRDSSQKSSTMKTYLVKELDTKQLQQVDSLLHLLSPSTRQIDADRLTRLIQEDRLCLFVTEDEDGTIVGILSLCICPTLAKDKLWIEDVVVDLSQRGKGIGRSLVQEAVSHARTLAPGSRLYLTSNPSRQAARALYASQGFKEYETGVFRIEL